MARKRNRNANGKPTPSPAVDVCQENDAVVVRIPVKFYRRNGRQMVLAQDESSVAQQASGSAPNQTLALMLAKAWQWQEQLESGEFSKFDDLGRANGVDRTYVSRVLKLTSLSPTIVESILSGNETEGLSVRSLNKGIPFLWKVQRWPTRGVGSPLKANAMLRQKEELRGPCGTRKSLQPR